MTGNTSDAIAAYVAATRSLEVLPSSTETSFYPDIKVLLSAVLKAERLPFEVVTGTSEARARGRDMPDFVLGDPTLFVAVYGEVKRADTMLADLAVSTENNDQIGRYLAQTGVVLLCNVRGFGLLTCDPSYKRSPTQTVPPKSRRLESPIDLWSAISGPKTKPKVDPSAATDLVAMATRAVTDLARIAAPADLVPRVVHFAGVDNLPTPRLRPTPLPHDPPQNERRGVLAKILAAQAREAKNALPDDLRPLKPLLDDYKQALGLAFDLDDERGVRFFCVFQRRRPPIPI